MNNLRFRTTSVLRGTGWLNGTILPYIRLERYSLLFLVH